MQNLAAKGSQRWLQLAVNDQPDLLLAALRRSGAVAPTSSVEWKSPLRSDDFKEYRDEAALRLAGIDGLKSPLGNFWPARGPVWDAIGMTTEGYPVFVEAKAHIPEAASPACRACDASRQQIEKSLNEARRWYAPRAKADWSGIFYQYANRLAHHYFLRQMNGLESVLVFLYFVNADDMNGPRTEDEWKGASRLIHACVGLHAALTKHGVYEAFVDVRSLISDAR